MGGSRIGACGRKLGPDVVQAESACPYCSSGGIRQIRCAWGVTRVMHAAYLMSMFGDIHLRAEAGHYCVNAGLICPEPRQAAWHPMSARPEPPGPAGRSLPLPNAPGSASCLHETMRASCSFSYPRIPRCRGPHIGVPAWRQDSTLTPCVTGMPAAHRPFASAAGVSRNQGALPGAFRISQAPAEPPSIPLPMTLLLRATAARCRGRA